jgi:DegV family protein with EDD domain
MRIKITSDSTCDLSAQLVEQNNITILPLTVVKDGETFHDGVDITPAEIFAHVNAGGKLCSTAAVNIDEYESFFEPFSKEYDAVIHINLGSGFSSCHQNAKIAAESFSNVYPIDSKNLSTGQGHLVLEACRLAQESDDITAICDELNELTGRIETSFLLSRLDYIAKGGRCSSVLALGANLLKLKPCIELKDGKMSVGKKYRGNYAKCLEEYVRERLDKRDDIIRDRLFVTYTPVKDDELKIVDEAVNQYGNFQTIYHTTAGCTVSCHCGPETLGVLFIRKK